MNIDAPADRWAGLPRESQSKANVPNNLGQQFLEYQKSLIHSTIVSILFKYIREANPLLRHKDKDFNIVLLFLVYLILWHLWHGFVFLENIQKLSRRLLRQGLEHLLDGITSRVPGLCLSTGRRSDIVALRFLPCGVSGVAARCPGRRSLRD